MALVAESGADLQAMLDSLPGYWELMVFGGCRFDSGDLQFTYKSLKLECMDKFRTLV